MFAVKGWSVDATALKPQTELFKAAKAKDGEEKQGRKRKRGQGPPAQDGDVGKLWDQHIEGKKPVKEKSQKKKERKKRRLDEQAAENAMAGKAKEDSAVSDGKAEGGAQSDTRPEKKNKKKSKGRSTEQDGASTEDATAEDAAKSAPPSVPPLPSTAKLTPMQSAMRQKLISARFRHLNQTLYTAPSAQALELFDQNPEMFQDYHAGFRQQVSVWPENPVDNFISTIRARGKVKPPKFNGKKGKPEKPAMNGSGALPALPRTHGTAIIADLGCGDARLAQTIKDCGDSTSLNLKIHSFDLHSPSPLVTKADISSLPLPDGSVDVGIFCLALMGTNWISFIEEAYRILHWKGELWVSEIKSRFGRVGRAGKPVEHSVGGKKKQAAAKKAQEAKQDEEQQVDEQTALRTEVDGVETKKQEETDVSAFVDVLRRRGFLLKDAERSVDLSNKMFVKMEFIKAATPTKGKGKPEETVTKPGPAKKKFVDEPSDDVPVEEEAKVLKPCLYKIR